MVAPHKIDPYVFKDVDLEEQPKIKTLEVSGKTSTDCRIVYSC